MKLYADAPARRVRQAVTDLLVVAWVALCVRFGLWLHETVLSALGPTVQLEAAGSSLQSSLSELGERLGAIPLLGNAISRPFERAADAGDAIGRVGADLGGYIEQTALVSGLAAAVIPLALVVIPWVLSRAAFARNAGAVRDLLATGDALDLLALRALATQPVRALAGVSPHPARDWREGRHDVVEKLAKVELARAGVAWPAESAPSRVDGA